MFLRELTSSVKNIYGIGSDKAFKLARLGLLKISDILLYYPNNWQDHTIKIPISGYEKGKVCTEVTVIGKEYIGFGAMKRLKVYIEDETAQAVLMCFNINSRQWLDKKFIIGSKLKIWGSFKYSNKYSELQSTSFESEDINNCSFGKIMPVYPLTAGITQNILRRIILESLKKYSNDIENELPEDLIIKYDLLSKKNALNEIHFPSSFEMLEKAKKTIIYEELFYLEIMIAKRTLERKNFLNNNENKKNTINFSPLQERLLERLTFKLTNGQNEAIKEINSDLLSNVPMARLLQGDVGSGKTLVSFMAAIIAAEKNGQTAIMAPTELLAQQHAENASRLLEPLGIKLAFLSGNVKLKGRKELLKNLANGNIDIIIGTHALFSKDVEYKNLKLVIIDEQHRFGVTQRSLIMSKGDNPALLMMSATPIPRTLALTVFGDMDVSVIKDMPLGRKPIKTHLAKESNEKKVYDYVHEELKKGRQAYFVYPLISEGEEIKDAVTMAERLSKEIFPNYKTALIHSKLPEEEKKRTMDDFRKGDIKILAATSVVEVGVDVPNAACMVIEHAQRFGLSALHQLRGRVGRGSEQSYCFLVYSDELSEEGKTRLKVMMENSDGFIIAEEDLKLRGPGQFTGKEQSGYLELGLSNPLRDIKVLEQAREDVFSILINDPDLLQENNRIIASVLEKAPAFSEVTL
ncbi:MAG: ATP-dependent DNA helicase RecG [Treponema sp.]|nr:ATP-dependent DNA helicase RecG [Treponema sp.]